MSIRFETAEDAEEAFYRAFERGDLAAMMEVWAQDEDIVCVHPGGDRLVGADEVFESWRRILAAGPQLTFRLLHVKLLATDALCVHSLYERITTAGAEQSPNVVLATNVYIRTRDGWRMLMHHASPLTAAPADEDDDEPPPVLH